MQAVKKLRTLPPILECGSLPTLAFLGCCFAAGLYFGWVVSGRELATVAPELTQYLSGYVSLSPEFTLSAGTFLSSALVYFRYPLLAFLLGFASFGVFLLPLLTVLFGFSFSYAVCCFAAAFGDRGVLLALTVLGIRCFVTLPCYFLLAVQAFGTSRELAGFVFGRGKRTSAGICGAGCLSRFLVCCGVLALGVVLDITLAPWLLRLVGDKLF